MCRTVNLSCIRVLLKGMICADLWLCQMRSNKPVAAGQDQSAAGAANKWFSGADLSNLVGGVDFVIVCLRHVTCVGL
jgi:hypothetical protein